MDFDARYQSLILANVHTSETIEQTMARATRYLEFMTNDVEETLKKDKP
jgi:hypothetical protein